MAELKDTADQFAKDLVAQNIAGLMMAFTPNGMMQAMALQQQMAANPPPAGSPTIDVQLLGQQGEDQVVDIVMAGADSSSTITTRWKDVAGAWKVDAIALKA